MCCLKTSKKMICRKMWKKKCGKIFTTICFVGKFTQKLLFWKISTKLRLVGKFSQKLFCWKISTKKRIFGQFWQKRKQCWIITTKKASTLPYPCPFPHSLKMSKFKLKKVPWKNPKSFGFNLNPPPLCPKKKLLYF